MLAIACGPPADNACSGAPSEADIDDVQIVASFDPFVSVGDGEIVTYVVGFQGLPMATFDIGYHGAPPDCLRREIAVDDADGNRIYGWDGGVSTLATAETEWRYEIVQVVEPPPGPLTVSIDAYGQTLTRTVSPSPAATIAAFGTAASPMVGVAMDVTITLTSPATRYLQINVSVTQGSATIDPAPVYVPYGETSAVVRVTPTASGSLVLLAQKWPPDFNDEPRTFGIEVP